MRFRRDFYSGPVQAAGLVESSSGKGQRHLRVVTVLREGSGPYVPLAARHLTVCVCEPPASVQPVVRVPC